MPPEPAARHLDLFSGIGGFALAARRVGWRTVGFCEIEPFACKVLAKHWPGVPIHDDIRTLDTNGIAADIITGGFPCQDISIAGSGAGIEGSRSGLWSELCRVIGEIRPSIAVMENVAALLGRGLERVLRDLAEIGFNAEWHCVPASAIGAPHRRDRIWIVAYPSRERRQQGAIWFPDQGGSPGTAVEFPHRADRAAQVSDTNGDCYRGDPGTMAAPQGSLFPRREQIQPGIEAGDGGADMADTVRERSLHGGNGVCDRWQYITRENLRRCGAWRDWAVEPDVGRVAHGVPDRVDRLKGLGNAIVPGVAEMLFRAIAESGPACFRPSDGS